MTIETTLAALIETQRYLGNPYHIGDTIRHETALALQGAPAAVRILGPETRLAGEVERAVGDWQRSEGRRAKDENAVAEQSRVWQDGR